MFQLLELIVEFACVSFDTFLIVLEVGLLLELLLLLAALIPFLPTTQLVQEMLPAAAHFPAGHSPPHDSEPIVLVYLPATQFIQLSSLLPLWYCPREQSTQ